MKLLILAFNFYINASIHVALAVCAFMRVTEMYLGISHDKVLSFFVFFATITGYNFVKYAGVAKLHHRGLTKNLQIIQLFSLVCFLIMGYCAWLLPLKIVFFFTPLTVLTFLYAVPFFSGFQKNLRSIGYLKIGVVAVVWTSVTVLLPVYANELPLTNKVILMALQRFLLVVVLILPFDIRDVQYDAISLQTIPKKIGIENTKKLGYTLLVMCLVIEFVMSPNEHFKTVFLAVFLLLLVLLMRAQIKQRAHYSSFWVEAIPILWVLTLQF